MKKVLFLFFAFMVCCSVCASAMGKSIKFVQGSPVMTVYTYSGNESEETGVVPVNDNTTLLVPLRPLSEALGINVDWNNDTEEVTLKFDETYITLKNNSIYASVNGDIKILGAMPRIVNGRFLVPLRFIAEVYGCNVSWDEKEKAAVIRNAQAFKNTVPIIMYHDINEKVTDATVVTPQKFEENMKLLASNGYTPISFEELISFVDGNGLLPEKPGIITFDDGYLSNYEYAFPILKKYNFCATVFVIGSSVGHNEYYKNTAYRLTPHFGIPEIMQMVSSSLISVQSHTYDMHQWAQYEKVPEKARCSAVPIDGESDADFAAALKNDIVLQNLIFSRAGIKSSNVLSFPNGKYADITNSVLAQNGYRATVTTDPARLNSVTVYDNPSLFNMGRFNITEGTTDIEILNYLNKK